jgi:hypothetical protein
MSTELLGFIGIALFVMAQGDCIKSSSLTIL